VKLEQGSVATLFRTAADNIADELSLAQRYLWRMNTDASGTDRKFLMGQCNTTTTAEGYLQFPVPMHKANAGFNSSAASTLALTKADLSAEPLSVVPVASHVSVDGCTLAMTGTGANLLVGDATALEADTDGTAFLEFDSGL